MDASGSTALLAPRAVSPFVGLSYYTEADAEWFFGRDQECQTIIANLRAARLTILYAPSGVGKSSLLRAGVAHRIGELARRRQAQTGTARLLAVVFGAWKDDPVDDLIDAIEATLRTLRPVSERVQLPRSSLQEAIEAATAVADARLLIILDQFEEYFLYATRESPDRVFADELARCVNRAELRANFLIAIREDAYAGLGDVFAGKVANVYSNHLALAYLDRVAARAAIEGPVEHFNQTHPHETPMGIEAALVDAVLDEVRTGAVLVGQSGTGGLPGGDGAGRGRQEIETPYLQLVMSTLWACDRQRGSSVLRLSTLRELGGARAIVRAHLDDALAALPEIERAAAVDVFQYLVTSSGAKVAYTAPDLAELVGRPTDEVAGLLAKLAHADARVLRHVPPPAGASGAADRYEIFHDVLAAPIRDWRARQAAERAERRRREAEAEARRERARARTFRALAICSMALLAVAAGLVIFAFVERHAANEEKQTANMQRREADRQKREADDQKAEAELQRKDAQAATRTAQSRALAAEAVQALPTAPVTALAESVKAVGTSATAQAETALRQAILANPIEYVIPATRQVRAPALADTGPNEQLAFSSDGKLVLGLRPDGALGVWSSSTGGSVTAIADVDGAVFGPSDRLLSSDGSVVRLDNAGSSQAKTWHLGRGDVVGIGFAGSAPLALVAGNRAAEVLNVATGSAVRLQGSPTALGDAVFSSDGDRVATQNAEFTRIEVWAARSGRLLATLPGCFVAACEAVSADGRFVATEGQLWSVDGRRRLAVLNASEVAFSPDGRLVAAVAPNGQASVYRSSSGQLIAVLPGSGNLVQPGYESSTPFTSSAAFSPDDRLIAIADADGIVRVWDLANSGQVAAVRAGWANELAFAPHSDLLAAMTWNGDVVVAAAPPSVALRQGNGPPEQCGGSLPAILTADGRRVMAPFDGPGQSGGGDVGIWSSDGRLQLVLRPTARSPGLSQVKEEAFSGDGTVAAAEAGYPGCVFIANPGRFGTVVARLDDSVRPLRLWATGWPLELDAHGSLVVIGRAAWRTTTGDRLVALNGIVALSPDGDLAVVTRAGIASIVRVPSGRVIAELPGAGSQAMFSPDGKRVLTQSSLDGLRLWDASTGRLVDQLGRPGERVGSFSFTRGGQFVLVAFGDRVATFNSSSGGPVSSIVGPAVSSIVGSGDAISSDGTLAAVADPDGSVEILDLSTGVDTSVQTDTTSPLAAVLFGPTDGLLIATDDNGNGYIVRCQICAASNVLLQHARTMLNTLSRYTPIGPPLASVR